MHRQSRETRNPSIIIIFAVGWCGFWCVLVVITVSPFIRLALQRISIGVLFLFPSLANKQLPRRRHSLQISAHFFGIFLRRASSSSSFIITQEQEAEVGSCCVVVLQLLFFLTLLTTTVHFFFDSSHIDLPFLNRSSIFLHKTVPRRMIL